MRALTGRREPPTLGQTLLERQARSVFMDQDEVERLRAEMRANGKKDAGADDFSYDELLKGRVRKNTDAEE